MNITDALSGLLNRYIEMVNSGDCGFWNPEKDVEVIAARAALGTIADIAQVEAAVIKTIEDIPAHGGGAMELYPATLRQKLSPEMIRTIARAALAAAQAGAPSEEDVERMICEWWGRTGRGILETSAINDLTRAVLALLRQDNK